MTFRLLHGAPCPVCGGGAVDDNAHVRLQHEPLCRWVAYVAELRAKARLIALALAAEQGKIT